MRFGIDITENPFKSYNLWVSIFFINPWQFFIQTKSEQAMIKNKQISSQSSKIMLIVYWFLMLSTRQASADDRTKM